MKYKIESIGEIKEGKTGEETYKTLDVVLVETEGQYPNSFVANLFKKGEYVKQAEEFATIYPIGTIVDAELKFKAREYQGKHFQNVTLWSIKKAEVTGQASEEPIEYPEEEINPEDIPF